MEVVSSILRRCAYGATFGMCSPSGAPLDVCTFMCVCTAVGRCSPSRVPVVVSMCVYTCTAFDMYGPSGVLSVQKCVCVCVCMLAQCSACAVRAVYLFCVACTVYPLHVSCVERAPRTYMCTVFGMGRLSDEPIVRGAGAWTCTLHT